MKTLLRGKALVNTALAYAARSWRVFPCHTPTAQGCSCHKDCGRIGKHPRTPHDLKDATTDEATIRRWWTRWPQANIGLATGAVSGLVVLDRDTFKGGEQSRVELEQSYSPLPETVQQLTGGGGVPYLFAGQVWDTEHLPREVRQRQKQERAAAFIQQAMQGRPPTAQHLSFLRSLGHQGAVPTDRADASVLIDTLLRKKAGAA